LVEVMVVLMAGKTV